MWLLVYYVNISRLWVEFWLVKYGFQTFFYVHDFLFLNDTFFNVIFPNVCAPTKTPIPDVTLTPSYCLCSGGESYYDRYNKICYFDQKGLISSLFSLKQVPRPLFVTIVTFSTNFTHITSLKLNKCHQFLSISYWSKQWVLVSIRYY